MSNGEYTDAELEASLRRAFVDHRADRIILDDRRQRFLIESARLGMVNGWLRERFNEIDEQSSQLEYRPTAKGRRHFGLAGVAQ